MECLNNNHICLFRILESLFLMHNVVVEVFGGVQGSKYVGKFFGDDILFPYMGMTIISLRCSVLCVV